MRSKRPNISVLSPLAMAQSCRSRRKHTSSFWSLTETLANIEYSIGRKRDENKQHVTFSRNGASRDLLDRWRDLVTWHASPDHFDDCKPVEGALMTQFRHLSAWVGRLESAKVSFPQRSHSQSDFEWMNVIMRGFLCDRTSTETGRAHLCIYERIIYNLLPV